MHLPPSIYEFELSHFDQFLDYLLDSHLLPVVPVREVFNFVVSESSLFVLRETRDDWVEDIIKMHLQQLILHFWEVGVYVPEEVRVVRMRDYVYLQSLFFFGLTANSSQNGDSGN